MTTDRFRSVPASPARARRASLLIALLLLASPAALLLAGERAASDSIAPDTGTLPTPRHSTTAIWTGESAYIFGGHLGSQTKDQVVRYDPGSHRSWPQKAQLPSGREGMASVWTGESVYLFGGDDGAPLASILLYHPRTDSIAVLPVTLPFPVERASAVWDGTHAYLFGGHDGARARQEIVRFTPASGAVTVLPVALPSPRQMTSAVWAGSVAYVFGGSAAAPLDEIVRFDPSALTVTVLQARLPSARDATSAAWDGTAAYVFGGRAGAAGLAEVVRFEPGAAGSRLMASALPRPLAWTSAVWAGDGALVFGGCCPAKRDILRYTVEPGAPRGLAAETSPGAIALTWAPPASDSFVSPIATYRVYRGTAPGTATLLAEVPASTLAHLDTGLPAGATYHYQVTAVTKEGESVRSAEVDATTPTVPGAPRHVLAWAGTAAGRADLAWAPPATTGGAPLTEYRIYRSEAVGSPLLVATRPAEDLTFTDTGLASGATYTYHVSALNGVGEGPRSDAATVATLPPPGAPQALTVTTGPGAGTLTLAWSAPSETGGLPVTAYRLYRGTVSGGEGFLTEVPGSVLTYTDTGRASGARYFYEVRAVTDAGEGFASDEASGTTYPPPAPPQDLVARSGPGVSEVSLHWRAPASDGGLPVTAYRLYRGETPALELDPFTLPADLARFSEWGVPAGETRFFRLSAVTDAGESARSNEAQAAAFTDPLATRPSLPGGRSATSAVWSGGHAYVLGGLGGTPEAPEDLDEIVRFDPRTGETVTLGVALPSPRHGTSAAWIPGHAHDEPSTNACHPTCFTGAGFVFGGRALDLQPNALATSSAPVGQQILRFDPAAGTVTLMGALLPSPRDAAASAWVPLDGEELQATACHPTCFAGSVFVFGGRSPSFGGGTLAASAGCADPCAGTEILRYDPATDTLTLLGARLPEPRYGAGAVEVAGSVYLFGGRNDAGDLASILRFDPATGTVTTLGAALPAGRCCGAAVWDGRVAFLFGGYSGSEAADAILRYDPATDTLDIVGELPSPRAFTSAVFDGQSAYVFGGEDGNRTLSEIVEFRPSAPQSLTAVAGAGEVSLAWRPPAVPGSSPLVGYQVYRSLAGGPWLLHAMVPADTPGFRDPGLPEDTPVEYKVSAVNRYGESPQSDPAVARTFARPSAPGNLSVASGPGVGDATLAWEEPEEDGRSPVVVYHVYRRVVSATGEQGDLIRIATVPAGTTSYVDGGCALGTTCTYTVTAENAVGEGASSNRASHLGTALLELEPEAPRTASLAPRSRRAP